MKIKLKITACFLLFTGIHSGFCATKENVFTTLKSEETVYEVPSTLSENNYVKNYNEGAQKVSIPLPKTFTGSGAKIDLMWNKNWLNGNAYLYNHGLARISCALCAASYTDVENLKPEENSLLQMYKTFGFDEQSIKFFYNIDYTLEPYKKDQSAFSFAKQKLSDGRTAVCVTIRGTYLTAEEWESNLNILDAAKKNNDQVAIDHEGFYTATRQVHEELKTYLAENNLSKDNTTFLITGHSRGASISNILGVKLFEDGYNPEKIFVYTVASPNVTQRDDVFDPKYSFIWNIINMEDAVPSMPFSSGTWNYRKYGNELGIICSATAPNHSLYERKYLQAMDDYFEPIMGREFQPFYTGYFIPYLISELITSINQEATDFYKSTIPLHNPLVAAVTKSSFVVTDQKETLVQKMIGNIIDSNYPGLMDSTNLALSDMHAIEAYLSWLLALSEEELYNNNDTYIIETQGFTDFTVKNSRNKTIVQIQNGITDIEKFLKEESYPVIWLGQYRAIIAVPGNQDLTLEVSQESLFNSNANCTLKVYTPGGALRKTYNWNKIKCSTNKISRLQMNSDGTNSGMVQEKGKVFNNVRSNNDNDFSLSFGNFFTSLGNIGLEETFGWPNIYAKLDISKNVVYNFKEFNLGIGIGSSYNIAGPFYTAMEASWNWTFDSDSHYDTPVFSTPKINTLFYIQRLKSLRFYLGIGANFYIKDLNPKYFDLSKEKLNNILGENSNLFIYPEFSLGIRF